MKNRFQKGDTVRYSYSDGSFDEGIITGARRKDGYYAVKFGWWGVQYIKPSHLKKQ